jgi:hypothetical protein
MAQVTKDALSTKGYVHSPAYDSGFLPVSDIHTLYYEQYGKQNGKPGKFFRLKRQFLCQRAGPQ